RSPVSALLLRAIIVAGRSRYSLSILAIYPGGRCSWSESPPRDRTTVCATHARHGAATPVERRSGPAETGPVGPSSSGASTSAPGRGRALGRAAASLKQHSL